MFGNLIDTFASHSTPAQTAWMYCKLPRRFARWVAQQRFISTVRWAARHSAFYREAFAARNIDAWRVRTPADLGDFYTTPDDLCARPLDFVCRTPSIVFESSGTSGRNKQVYYDDRELREVGATMAAGLGLMGLRKDDRVVNAFDFSIWIPGLMTHYGLMAAGAFCQAFGKVDPVEVYRRMGEFKYTVVIGEPTWLIRLTQLAENDSPDGISKYPLRLLIGGAEEMPREAIPWMKRVWGGATVKMNYGSVEMASGIGFQPCENDDGYHLDYVDFLPEIFEPDEEGFGEMVFTTLTRRVMPLIRYRTRDVTRIETQPCACGLPAPRIARLRGRRDELVVASGGNLYPLMFENILRKIEGITHDWQVVFTLEGVREILTINIETERDDADALEREVHRHAADLYPDLMKNLALGIFELRIATHRPGNVRTARKLRRMIDRRHFSPVMRSVEGAAIEETNGAEVRR